MKEKEIREFRLPENLIGEDVRTMVTEPTPGTVETRPAETLTEERTGGIRVKV